MELFRSRKKEKPDIEFITKAKLKKLELTPPKRSEGDLFMPHLASEEPRGQSRWILRIPSETGINEFWTTFARPTMSQDRHEIPYMSTTTWQRGRMTWNDIYLEIRGGQDIQSLSEWFRTAMIDITGRQGYGGGPKRNIEIEMLDPTGIIIEKWTIQGCFPTEVTYHQEMDDMDPIIGVNLSIDRAILIT